ncbi:MAG: hypothetical protein EWV50_16530 [Microcystis aeruginosa Ma_MB_F_20061100_S20]|uniref:Uncharacterized protein n=1 Tax=Microcystis aeruginosa Ma_MB_F_20061100_S20D TaxID=2486253 RepID=A0A552ET72_MICAE|nr:MAG: hypothetical protein EWV50_16530 [Microcystis aeruginosa Ma_MB_F_20061100_S20]TRU37664.1 MAG: hypothetical protein EWV78_06735 [Microcystis aeruginosa Ma_MB_F_20061100_S20D]
MTEPILDKLSERIDTGVRIAIAEAIERHRLLGESISIFKDGQIVTLTAAQIPPKSDLGSKLK